MRFISNTPSVFSIPCHWVLVIKYLYRVITEPMGTCIDEQSTVYPPAYAGRIPHIHLFKTTKNL